MFIMSAKNTSVVLFLIFLVMPSESDRILAIMPTPSYSHQIVFNPLWLALNSRGHHVTLFTTDPIKDANVSNFRQVNWSFAYEVWHGKHNVSNIINNYNKKFLKALMQYAEMISDIMIQELEHPEVQAIMNDENEHFDLVIVEFLTPAMIPFSERFNCPFIGVNSMDVTNFIHEALDNPISPALFPDLISTFDSDMNFFERFLNTFNYLGTKLYFKYHFYPQQDKIARKFFGENILKLEKLQRHASMLFLNINPLLHNIKPLMNNILSIGGVTHVKKDASLPSEIQMFLNEAKIGAIFFSLGTNLKGTDLLEETKSLFSEAFSELPYKVLWKFEDSSISTKPNCMIKKWLPQQQILKHPNIKLFITQGGLQSLEEAIYNGVPIIGMPVFLDQYANVKRVVRKGMGISLDFNTLEKEELKNAINEVINNPKFKNAAVRLSGLLKDQPISGIEQAVWWTEYVLKHRGAKLLKHCEIPLYQYLLLDVFALFLFLFSVFLFSLVIFLKYFVYFIKQRRRQKFVKLE